jgi:hypothetical protein
MDFITDPGPGDVAAWPQWSKIREPRSYPSTAGQPGQLSSRALNLNSLIRHRRRELEKGLEKGKDGAGAAFSIRTALCRNGSQSQYTDGP